MQLIFTKNKANASNLRSLHSVEPAMNWNKMLIAEKSGDQNDIF